VIRRALAILSLAVASFGAAPASAGEARCWVDHGAVMVSAAIGDIAGDFLLDLSAPQSQLHVTSAQADGFGDSGVMEGPLRLAGERLPVRLTVTDLDARTLGYPTTIDGLIGADALEGWMVELRLSPCRLILRRAARLKGARTPIVWIGGVPTLPASVFDGRAGLAGRFRVDTGSAGVRLSSAIAALSRAPPKGVDPGSRIRPPARLAALGLDGEVLTRLRAGLASDAPPGVAGGIGTDVLAGYALRLDLKRNVAVLTPLSARRSARSCGSCRRAGR
jgi:hypothetical protein